MDLIRLLKGIAPEISDILEIRYNILRHVYYNQPIGRRGLSQILNIGERAIRTEVNILKELGLLNIESMGMYVTEDGIKTLESLKAVMRELRGITNLEVKLKQLLALDNVIIVPGDSDLDPLVLKDMGKSASLCLRRLIADNSIIGITGGTTMAQVAEEMPEGKVAENVLVIPARGGLGKDVETQSNSIAAKLAKKLQANYRLLHTPDNLDEMTFQAILKVTDIKEVIELINQMNILIFGIGRSDVMARRRQLPETLISEIIEKGAVGEAFGHYFDIEGNDIYESLTVGISLDNFYKIQRVIGVAGGKNKAEAIIAVTSLRKDITLVTDEGAARKVIQLVKKAT
ncbi:sugar-binding transcriptional regulator [Tepidimicrobium xylanilyticum]|uniref:Central glycolytic genes regulator n=1 Tax=Tepidimicrobium xylanilyticum TaxID=1123352 RepID=A0A1H3A1N2_9FIRM|nr:sugar-binding domain-containing protein [Tepidimicrobium xylanilyticum]GMG96354.1 central glycolytic genes regulator [Tepidimicrobium xylanilyticum]SDX23084.1 central glycolytic genes regulator [Tepidimicrobium xylanilyticum]